MWSTFPGTSSSHARFVCAPIRHLADVPLVGLVDDVVIAFIEDDLGHSVAMRGRPPTGPVTFLLTDVEGSTLLWERDHVVAAAVTACHYELLDAAIALRGGVRPVEQGEGDSVVAAFTKASAAIATALDAQRAFAEEPWPEKGCLRVRIALNSGE